MEFKKIWKSSLPEKRFRKSSFGIDIKKPIPASDEECKKAINTEINNIGNDDSWLRDLKDQTKAVLNWIEKHKNKFPTEIQKGLEERYQRVHNTYRDYRQSKWTRWTSQKSRSQKFKEASEAIRDYLQYAKPHIEAVLLAESVSRKAERVTLRLGEVTNYILQHQEAFQELGYNIMRFQKIHSELQGIIGGDRDEPDGINPGHAKLFVDNSNAIFKMNRDLSDYLSIDDRSKLDEKLDGKRKRRIDDLLERLPRNKEDRPTLSDLSRRRWWKLYINTPLHEKAQQSSDPGGFCDVQDPGYEKSMLELFETKLVPAKGPGQERMNDDSYRGMHEIATKYLSNDERDRMRIRGGIDNKRYTRYKIISKDGKGILYERIRAFQEM